MIATQTMPTTPTRTIRAKVEHYKANGITLQNTFSYNNSLKSVDVNRCGTDGKLVGMCIGQKVVVKIIDRHGDFTINKGEILKVYFDNGQGYITPFPSFHISNVETNTITKEITITGYDLLKTAERLSITRIELQSYSLYTLASEIAYDIHATGVVLVDLEETDTLLNLYYEQGANFSGNETYRQVLEALAEALQVVIYLDSNDNIVLKRLAHGTNDATITKAEYFSYTAKEKYQITKVAHITELGDNVAAASDIETTATAATLNIRNNPFYELRDDIGDILEAALDNVKYIIFNCFDLHFRGNYLIEIGDRFFVVGGGYCYLLNDTISYTGGLTQKVNLNNKTEDKTQANPSTLGEALKQTSAKVDKVNQQIDLVASQSNINASDIASIKITTDKIQSQIVSQQSATDSITDAITTLTNSVSATMTADEVQLAITTAQESGATKVETTTGFTFDDTGLTVSKTNSEMETKITEDGMTVYRNGSAVLTADNEGVTALDLKAQTFLIIGKNSRFEDYGSNRTACFWIGGTN